MPPQTRHSRQRQLVLQSVKSSQAFRTADDIFRQVRRRAPTVGLATVYRNLEALERRGEIFGIEGENGSRHYLGHAFHEASFTCQRCGTTRRLNSRTLDDYVQRKMMGPQIVFFSRLEARGLCAACGKKVRRR